MIVSVSVFAVTCLLMILSVLFFPAIRLGKVRVSTYWVITLLGAAVMLLTGPVPFSAVWKDLVADTAVNPLKILALFLSMTVLSVFLDELGFFRFLASFALRHAHKGQAVLFFSLYAVVSVLTVFTSNDIIILSFTPFLCYFAKNAEIDPVPYLAAEFVAANTWSMALLIGNPTNIYLATALGIDFFSYLKVSILPTFAAGLVSLPLLYLLFRKQLKKPLGGHTERVRVEDKLQLAVGIVHLAVCTVLLAAGSYIGLEMWLVAVVCAGSLFVCTLVISAVRRKKPRELLGCLRRAPYPLVPFVLSMFAMISVLTEEGATAYIATALGDSLGILKYGTLSFLASNVINNIPMSVLFSSILTAGGHTMSVGAVFATVIGSNLGALFTPIGALAGIMWSTMLKENGVKFGYLQFLKLGAAVAVPALAASLLALWAVTAWIL